MSLSNMKFAHTDGYALITYTTDGNYVITGGADGDVRVYLGNSETESNSILVGDEVLGLACDVSLTDRRVFVAALNTNTVQEYSIMEDGKKNPTVIARFTSDVTSICVSRKGDQVCAGSADMSLKVINRETFKDVLLEGHTAPILSVAFNPAADHVLSSSCDGSVRIWNVAERRCVKQWSDLWKESNDVSASKTRGVVSWNPSVGKNEFAVPTNNAILVISQGQLNQFKEDQLPAATDDDEIMSTTGWSFDGKFLASGTSKGRIFVWKRSDKSLVATLQSPRHYEICSMAWHPSKAELSVMDMTGHWGVITKLDNETVQSSKSSSANVIEKTGKVDKIKSVMKTSMKEDDLDDLGDDDEMLNDEELAAALFEDDDDDDNENSFSIRKIKKETGFAEDGGRISPASTIMSEVSKVEGAPPAGSVPTTRAATPVYDPEIQAPFQPGSTPVHLQARFMVWNSVGVVKCINDDSENSVDVEFHDSSLHHAIHITNMNMYTMADLSNEALVLAREAQGNDDDGDSDVAPSKLMCHYFGSSDMNKEWSIDMAKDEEILAIACGTGWVAAATDRRNLRLFSVGGMQREVLSLPGPIVALAGHGSQLAVAVHLGMPLPGNQNIGVAVFNVGRDQKGALSHPLPNFQPIPLAPRSTLSWLGFTDENNPCIMDSAGFLRIWNRKFGSTWIQVCDTKSHTKGKKDNHFLIGISERDFSARTIYVKGSHFPATVPYPTVTIVPLSVPLAGDVTSEKTSSELDFWKSEIILASLSYADDVTNLDGDNFKDAAHRIQVESLLKLFALACKTDHDSRALEICKLMDDATIQLAIKYASKMRRMQLANKISEIACARQEEEPVYVAPRCPSQASVDLFATQRDDDYEDELMLDDDEEQSKRVNPILEAKKRKEISRNESPASLNWATPQNDQGKSANRNPFKKSSAPKDSPSGIRSGIVFDDMAKPEMTSSASKSGRNSFGSRKIEPSSGSTSAEKPSGFRAKISLKKKVDIGNMFHQAGKENAAASSNTKEGKSDGPHTPLFGFQLWLAENKEDLATQIGESGEEALREAGLAKWKDMSKEEKEEYKPARLPNVQGSAKRKVPDTQPTDNVSSKLARFAASKD